MERLITVPVERGVNGTPRTAALRSISLYGLSDVILTFQDGTDNYFARQQIFNAIPGISLPAGITPSVSPMSSPSGLIYRYVLQSPDRSPMELKNFETWIIEPAYRSVPGVADDPASAAVTCSIRCCSIPPKWQAPACRWRKWKARSRPTIPTPAAASIRKGASSIM